MGVHKSRQDDLAGAIDLDNFLAVLPDPWIAQGVFTFAGRNNFLAYAQHRAILDDAEVLQRWAAARAVISGRRLQRQQLADVDEQQRTIVYVALTWRSHAMVSLAATVGDGAEPCGTGCIDSEVRALATFAFFAVQGFRNLTAKFAKDAKEKQMAELSADTYLPIGTFILFFCAKAFASS